MKIAPSASAVRSDFIFIYIDISHETARQITRKMEKDTTEVVSFLFDTRGRT